MYLVILFHRVVSFLKKQGEFVMRNYKNRPAFILVMVVGLLSLSSVSSAMNSSIRRMSGPAMGSEIRYTSGSVSSGVTSNIAVPSYIPSQQFTPMSQQLVSYSPQKVDVVSNLNIDINKLMQSLEQEQENSYDDGSSSSNSDSDTNYWKTSMFATFMATMAAAKQQADIDKEEEQSVDTVALLDKKSLDARVYPELAKFIQKYSCSLDLETRANFVSAGNDYFNSLKTKSPSDFEVAKNNPMYQKAGFFNRSIAGKGEFIPTSGDIFKGSTSSEFFIKGSEIDRIINAQRMMVYLKVNKLNNFKVVSECLMHSGKSMSVVSNKIDIGNQRKKLSLRDVQQLVKITEDTGYCDWQFGRNVICDSQGKFVFVDTEDVSFLWWFNDVTIRHVLMLLMLNSSLIMEKTALDWLKMKIEFSDKYNDGILSLSENIQYDAAIGIDFEQVKREFELFKEAQIVEVD